MNEIVLSGLIGGLAAALSDSPLIGIIVGAAMLTLLLRLKGF